MLLNCTLLECQGPSGCFRANKRLKADIKRSIADLKQEYTNPQWPLVYPPVISCTQTEQKQQTQEDKPMPILEADVLSHIANYLSRQELYVFIFTNKTLMSGLSVEVVIKSAMMTGGNAAKTIGEIQRLMSTGSIYPPSALRLLCLTNGKRCEICGVNVVKHVRKGYGIMAC